MRDSKRIRPTLDAIEALWQQHPDMRLGQLIGNLAGRDPFFIEDDEMVQRAADAAVAWAGSGGGQ